MAKTGRHNKENSTPALWGGGVLSITAGLGLWTPAHGWTTEEGPALGFLCGRWQKMCQRLEGSRMTSISSGAGNCSGAEAEGWVCGGGFRIYSLGHSCVCGACGHQGTGRGVLLPAESKGVARNREDARVWRRAGEDPGQSVQSLVSGKPG